MITKSFNTWSLRYDPYIKDLYHIFLSNVNEQKDVYYSPEFYNQFKRILFKSSSGFISNFI
jgi:hypothetical protein